MKDPPSSYGHRLLNKDGKDFVACVPTILNSNKNRSVDVISSIGQFPLLLLKLTEVPLLL
jgi:uncharacterized protein YqjF (DUF2071 family)